MLLNQLSDVILRPDPYRGCTSLIRHFCRLVNDWERYLCLSTKSRIFWCINFTPYSYLLGLERKYWMTLHFCRNYSSFIFNITSCPTDLFFGGFAVNNITNCCQFIQVLSFSLYILWELYVFSSSFSIEKSYYNSYNACLLLLRIRARYNSHWNSWTRPHL